MPNGEESRVRAIEDLSVRVSGRPAGLTAAKIVVRNLNAYFGKTQALKNI